MSTIKEYLDYAELAQASYGLKLKEGMFGKDNADYVDELSRKDSSGKINFSQVQAENFSNRYEVLATSTQYGIGDASSFDAILFLDQDTGKKILAIRGSQEVTDYVVDAGLGISGLVYGQNVSLNNFYDALVSDNKLSLTDKVDVTGHSLGGYLAQLFTASHSYAVDNAYTYNAPGIGGLNQEIQELFGLKNQSDYNDKITNLYAENGSEFVAGLGVMLGDIIPLTIDPDAISANNHRIGKLTESLHLYDMLSSITQVQDVELLTSILEHISNEKVIDTIKDIFNSSITGTNIDQCIELAKNYKAKATDITNLISKTQTQLQDKTLANLYALENLNPFVIQGDFEVYNNIDVSKYTDQYLEDRATYLYYLLDKKNRYDIDPALSMTAYEDVELGSEYTLEQSRSKSKIVFGGDSDNTLIGSDGSDRLYAGLGNDTIEAGQGTNYIDGGTGSDTISYKKASEGIDVNLSLAAAQAINSTTTDTLINIENVIGSKYADYITGKDNTTTTLNGGFGNDTLYGGNNSENMLLGEDDDDRIVGGTTTDEIMLNANKLVMNYLDGGEGKDYLIAGRNANNYLYGGAGDDDLVSTLIGFKNESAGIDYSKGSSYLNGGEGFDNYTVKDYVTIEDDDGLGEIQTTYGKLQDLTMRTFSDGRVLLLKNYPIYIDGTFATVGNFGRTTTTQGMILDNYVLVFKLSKDGNDLILNDLSTNPTVIRIKNYTANSLKLNITQDMFNNLPSLDGNQTPSPTNPILVGTNEVDTLIGSDVNNTFISNAGNDTLKDLSGGNDIYKFKKGDGIDTITDIKGNDVIQFDDTILKSDITFSQSDDLKSLIINYSPTDKIIISNYFDSFYKIENIQLSNGEKLIPEFNTQTIGKNLAENLVTGYGNDTVVKRSEKIGS
jgi:Ca2+-binding RTX toxin-like protein